MAPSTFTRIVRTAPFHDEGRGFDVFGLDPRALAKAVSAAAPIYERYFRVDSVGAEHIPAEGPAILVANHAGFLPIDAALLCLDVLRRAEPPRIPRAVADHFVPRLPLVSTLFARMGAVSGTRANVRRLLERGELIAIFPEGVTGPGKAFRDRYKIQSWRVGFAELAIRYRAPVVPVAIIGAEEAWPILGKLRLRLFGAPYLPVPASLLPLPAHVHLRFGAPLELHRGRTPRDAADPEIVATAAADARRELEQLIAVGLRAREGVFR
jgi:1-acyl-sn-glycerol-3-phosphate acyltransferase